VQQAVEESDKNVVIIASGDLSHKLTPDSPNGYTPLGKEFDEKLLDLLSKSDVEGIVRMDKRFIEEAAECGMRSIIAMLGALDGYEFSANVLSHEGPFGVGYGVVAVEAGNRSKGRELLDSIKAKHFADMKRIRDGEDPYVALARQTVETYIRQGKVIKPGKDLPDEMFTKKAGVFVSIHKNGELRGCIGTISPVYENVASEIIHNAISASTRDPRFEPIEENELDVLEYSVDVLNPAEPVDSIEELDPKRYGVIVRRGYRSGLLLPDLEGVDTPQQQLSIALQKAGIRPDEPYTIERFTVERHK
jgi:AmmeMemoRadiSam system protein A